MTDESEGAKDWVTIKLPASVRDQARPDPRTYGEIMQAGLDAPNPESDADVNRDLLAEQVVDLLAAELGDPAELREQLDRIQSAAETAEERTGRIEGALEDAGIGR